jgi:hypothetical protein
VNLFPDGVDTYLNVVALWHFLKGSNEASLTKVLRSEPE